MAFTPERDPSPTDMLRRVIPDQTTGRDNAGLVFEAQDVVKAANELRTRLVVINNALRGPQPKDRDEGAKAPQPSQVPLQTSLAEAQALLSDCHKLASQTYEILGI